MNAPRTVAPITATRIGYPFRNKEKQEITDPQAFYKGLASVQGGHYLLGAHGFFHGGIHFDRASRDDFALDEGIRCLADGEVVAYRINRHHADATPGADSDGPALQPYSTGFVLVRHRLQAPTPPQPPKPVPIANPMADRRNMGTYLYEDPEGRTQLAWLRYETSLTVEVGPNLPGNSNLVRVLDVIGPGLPRAGWINRIWLALDPLAGTGLLSVFGLKERVKTYVINGDRPDPAMQGDYSRNQRELAKPAPPTAPTLTLYSLYMHLADYADYQKHPTRSQPAWWQSGGKCYRVGEKAKDRQAGTRERSGRQWVDRFPTSHQVADLTPTFASSVGQFIQALQSAGASVRVSATYRPVERAYLMHYSWRIAREGMGPTTVPAMEGVNIDWAHLDAQGVSDREAAVRAARDMVAGYDIVYRPSLTSHHTERRAIDMTITGATGRNVRDASGQGRLVNSSTDLYAVGRSYGVIKLLTDPPHWSDDGR